MSVGQNFESQFTRLALSAQGAYILDAGSNKALHNLATTDMPVYQQLHVDPEWNQLSLEPPMISLDFVTLDYIIDSTYYYIIAMQ